MRWFVLLAFSIGLAACGQPSPPGQEPQPTRVFTIYFDVNSADLTPTAQVIVGDVAEALRRERPSKIIVEGQASGGTQRDAELAVQRTDKVVAALVKAGVDPNAVEQRNALVGPATSDTLARISAHKVLVEFLP